MKEKKQSVWIAQREGRAKDGFDKTNPGVLKMFGLAAEGDLLDHIISLNIAPVSLSYEYDPCDEMKIPELLSKAEGKDYVKAKGEDERSMRLGIMGQKGRVHFQFGKTINEEINEEINNALDFHRLIFLIFHNCEFESFESFKQIQQFPELFELFVGTCRNEQFIQQFIRLE